MLSDTQFREYITFIHALKGVAKEYITITRNSEPNRMVGVRAKNNVCSWVVSSKMGRSISTESRTAEKSFVILSEYDDSVLEIWDQPQPVQVVRTNKRGRLQKGSYNPDFLVLSNDGPKVVEVKPAEVLEELIESQPDNWVKRANGEYSYLPAKKAFSDMGLAHEVFCYSRDIRYRVANLELMLRSRSVGAVEPCLQSRLYKLFEESFSWSLYGLKNSLSLNCYTPLIQLVDQGEIFFDIDNELLSEPRGCFITSDMSLVGESKALRDSQKIYNDDLLSISIAKFPSYSCAAKALEKLRKIESGAGAERSIRRWKQQVRVGSSKGLTPFQSLIPRTYLSGNRVCRVSDVVVDYLQKYFVNTHGPSQGLSDYRSYIRYKDMAKEHHPDFDPVSRRTFMRRLREIPASVIAKARQGRRGENAAADPSDPTERSLKAQLPWQAAAIDHYKADVYLVFYSNNGQIFVERPWITAMIDLSTGAVLAITLSFRDPSRNSCAKVIRECVRTHCRLPLEIIVDRGSDFRSVYFSALLAHYGVTLSLRPSAHSRYGGEVEGLFGEFKKMWLTQRPGNLADFEEARSVDGKLSPKQVAILKPYDFYKEIKAFTTWRDARPKGVHLESGRQRFLAGQKEFPFVGVSVNYDQDLMLATAVESKAYTVDFRRGIHIDDLYYYTPNIANIRGKKSKTEVRRDPENPHVVYALIDDIWEPCYSSQINSYSSLDQTAQFEQGLVAIEGVNLRRKVREEFDVELSRMCREMDKVRTDGEVPLISACVTEISENLDSKEDELDLDLDNLRVVSVGEW